jgi:hypothetical protein
VADYAERWLNLIEPTVKRRTIQSYAYVLRHHLLPAFGRARVTQLSAGWILEILVGKLRSGLSKGTVRIILATLRAMLNRAKFEGVVDRNPADRLAPHLKLVVPSATRQEVIRTKAMTREQLVKFLQTAALSVYERWVTSCSWCSHGPACGLEKR